MRRGWPLVYALLTTALLSWRFNDWAYDDIFITYRYANNLASGMGMVYQAGERVLSTTSVLWAVLLSPFAALGGDVRTAAILLGALSLAVGGYCLWQIGQAAHQPWIAWAGLLLYPLHPLVTGTLGSETPLYLALGLGALALQARRRYDLAACCAGLAAAARPDGLLFAALIGWDGLARCREARRGRQACTFPRRSAGFFLLTWMPWVLWTWVYYGSPLPVTLAAKQQQAKLAVSASFWQGFWQTLQTLAAEAYFCWELGLAVLGGVFLAWWVIRTVRGTESRRALADLRPVLLVLAWTGAYFAAYVVLGVTRYFWYYAPLLPALIVGIGWGMAAVEQAWGWFSGRLGLRKIVRILPAALVCLGLFAGQAQAAAQSGVDARTEVYRQVGVWLADHTDPQVRVGALEVGVIGYYSQRRMVDFAGLLQPATAEQLSLQGGYDRTALWVVQEYAPEILVLQDGLFPELESWMEDENCVESTRFPGLKWELVVYTCAW